MTINLLKSYIFLKPLNTHLYYMYEEIKQGNKEKAQIEMDPAHYAPLFQF